MKPVACVHSCYQEKFGIPRQPGLVNEAKGEVRLLPEFSHPDIVRGLDEFSHLWLVFQFHATAESVWKPTVRPPRLGGDQRLGVFATRSMFRPNPVGLSVVRLESIQHTDSGIVIFVSGLDLLDGTPVLDIKPYLPYADSVEAASGGFAPEVPEHGLAVEFSLLAEKQCILKSAEWSVNVRLLLVQILQQDPRPAYRARQNDDHEYGMKLYDFDVRWVCRGGSVVVLELVSPGD
uniref:COG1720: Uncharacterized conserved protein n=1 Tax=uncultured Thiotrichaceae bacterium TaxID=298394 RepID=A0A6S6UAQ5_9GAMM|nr:MAG: COG1720: Uncharacterized conserved protein [uncultured Thiotrichaceae bacterium]